MWSVRLPGCKPYAQAVAEGDEINKCVPGGDQTMRELAELMGVEPKPLATAAEREKNCIYS